MSIDMISFVGIDERTDLRELERLASLSVVKLEFGVLYSETKKANRYPEIKIIDNLASMYNHNISYSKSIHLCGNSVHKFLNLDTIFFETIFGSVDYRNEFDAVQLNFMLRDEKDIPEILHKATTACWRAGIQQLIFQVNKSKQGLIDYIVKNYDNLKEQEIKIRLLYDASGGVGREINNIEKPFNDFYTGYAGGIKPENVNNVIYDLEMISGATPVYIDMESGVRDDDWFSIKRCEQIIEAVNKLKSQSIWSSVE